MLASTYLNLASGATILTNSSHFLEAIWLHSITIIIMTLTAHVGGSYVL